jgi:anthranilate 1,2-dioxygenase large subunit
MAGLDPALHAGEALRMTVLERQVHWPRTDYSKVPFWLYHDAALYELEQERIFRGPTWSFLGLEAEIPNVGDWRSSWIGDTPVVFNRDRKGEVRAFVNRCVHRGAAVCRGERGNSKVHTCIYHRWSYDLEGNLVGVPFRHGVGGKGGLDPSFDLKRNGLRKLRVESLNGVVFASFSDEAPALEAYLGPMIAAHVRRMFPRPVRILGYQRQLIRGNWKLYLENLRDTYHASLLHEFMVTFGIDRATQKGGVKMDDRHRHNFTYAHAGSDSDDEAVKQYGQHQLKADALKLQDPRLLKFTPELGDDLGLAIPSVFPNAAFQQISNSLAARQVRTRGVDAFELFWIFYGFAADDEAMTQHRLRQSNLVGPAGYVSMEDGEAIELAHRSTVAEPEAATVIEMGGRGAIHDCDYRVTDIPLRGFWSYWAELMGYEPPGAVR